MRMLAYIHFYSIKYVLIYTDSQINTIILLSDVHSKHFKSCNACTTRKYFVFQGNKKTKALVLQYNTFFEKGIHFSTMQNIQRFKISFRNNIQYLLFRHILLHRCQFLGFLVTTLHWKFLFYLLSKILLNKT